MAMEGKYGQLTVERKELPKDEPVFLLRGQDKFAAQVVQYYAELREKAGDRNGAEECRKQAQRMADWPVKKMPD